MQQIFVLSGVNKGLTRTADSILGIDATSEEQVVAEQMKRARDDPRVVRLREAILDAIRRSIELWSTDASISSVCSSASNVSRGIHMSSHRLSTNWSKPSPLYQVIRHF